MTNCKQSERLIGISSIITCICAAFLLWGTSHQANKIFYIVLLVIIITQVLSYWYLKRFFFSNVKKFIDYIKVLSQGKLIEIQADDVAQFQGFKFLTRLSNQWRQLKNYSIGLNVVSGPGLMENGAGQSSLVSNSIKIIDTYIKRLKDEASEWKEKEEKRSWTNKGIAKFSDILRHSNKSIEALSQEFLRQLIKYINGNQGGIFIVNRDDNENEFLEMVASYAYNRDRFPDKTCSVTDGMLGAVCFEMKTIYMTKVPEKYLNIRSGMGDAPPDSVLLVPLLYDEKIFGVIELASFKKYEQYVIDFIEKVGEGLAATIASVQISNTTAKLLAQSQNQAQELQRQEEELRQSIEEMKAQQDEMEMKRLEVEENKALMSQIIDLVPYPIFVKNINRQYIIANQAQARLFNLHTDQLLGRTDNDLINDFEELDEILKSDNKVLKQNQLIKLPEQSISLPSGERKIMQTIKVPFVNNITKNRNILGVSIDFTEQRELERKLKETRKEVELLAQQVDGE